MQWIFLIIALPLAYVAKMLFNEINSPMLANTLRLLFALPIFLSIRRTGLKITSILQGASIAAISAAILTIPQAYSGTERVVLDAIKNPIPLGNFSLLLGAIGGTLWLFRHSLQVSQSQLICSVLGLVAGIWVSIASGSRGGWLAIPVIAWVYSLTSQRWRWHHRWGLVLCVVVIGIFSAFLIPTIQHRLQLGFQEIQQYLQHTNHWKPTDALGSLDTRLEMWRLGSLAFIQAPWWGVGFAGFDDFLTMHINQGTAHPNLMMHSSTSRHHHLHNEIVTTAARLGIIGLLALSLLWLGGWQWLRKNLNHPDPTVHSYSIIGLLVHGAVITFSLTDSMFGMGINTMLYAVLLGTAAGGLRHAELHYQAAACRRTMPA